VIAAVVVASAIAGAAIDRQLLVRRGHPFDGGRRSFQEQEDRRRTGMLDRLTKELSLTAVQRAGLDTIFRRTDSSLRAIRREAQPRIQQLFERSRAEVNARLDSAQREKFAKMRQGGPPRDHRGGGSRADSARQ
jgi:hypothetical protein